MKKYSMQKFSLLGTLVLGLLCLSAGAPAFSQAADKGEPPMKTVHVADIDIACMDFGAGDPILMIMGYGGSMDFWSPRLLKLLSASHRVILFDNRGMGHSTSSDQEYSIPLFAEDTLGLMNALSVERATVLAWSLGTEIALELAITHPTRVANLVLISGNPGGKEKIDPDAEVLQRFADDSGTALDRGLRLIRLLFPLEWLLTHPFIPSYFPTNAKMNPTERTRRQLFAMTSWEGSYNRLGQITSPALIIAGDADVLVPPGNSVLLANAIHSSRLIRIPGGGHGVTFQYPDRIADEIAAFLKDAGN